MKWRLIIPLVFFSSPIWSQDSIGTVPKYAINGYIKNLESISFDNISGAVTSGNLLHQRLNCKWKPSDEWNVSAEVRNRLFWGEEVRSTPAFAQLLRNENESVNLQKAWISKPYLVLHTNVERLYLDYRPKKWNIRLGRQRVNWGVTTTWNPNDIFNAYNFLDFDYEERPGIDGAKIQYTFSKSFNTEFAFRYADRAEDRVAAVKYALNQWGYDFQVITGCYKGHITAGAGWAGNIKESGFKGEVQYYFGNKDTSDHFNLSIEDSYMFKNGWYVSAGLLLNGKGIHQPVSDWNNLSLKVSPENLMPTKWNFIASTSKEITPLLSAAMSTVYAPGTQLLMVLPSLKFNMATNLDVDVIWQIFSARLKDKFGIVNHRGFLRLKWSY